MRILAIETATRHGSVALADESGAVLQQRQLPRDRRTAATLAPGLAKVLSAAKCSPGEVDVVAVSIGPGSFTGLRLGVTTAKSLAYAVGAGVLPVGTLRAIAQQGPPGLLSPALDAQRGQLFAGLYCREDQAVAQQLEAPRIVDLARWLDRLRSEQAKASGPVLQRLLASGQIAPADVVPEACWAPRAASVAQLAAAEIRRGVEPQAPFDVLPFYLRPSAAEEKRAVNRQAEGPA